ncbi:MAG TPA: tetratricopeptide repeat protein, partial [Bacteroidia bacterium]|nr:tetratricopeptide repeat protein [Bacteroidia bacterium]
MVNKLKYCIVFGGICLLFLFSCTQYKTAFINRQYHNLTAHFNGYFYAKESLKDGVGKIELAYKDDYTKILPIFIYPSKESAKATFPEMDRAIKKASTCIQKHAIKDKHSKAEIPNMGKWIDDCWNTIGKSHFYKREYFSGIEAFDYVQAVYKSKQKYEAWLWLAKSYLELNALTSAQNYLHLCENDKKFPKEYKGQFEVLYAEFYMKQNAYDDVIKRLKEALKYTKEHSARARYHFILGQLFEQKDDAQKAKIHYQMAVKNKPIYDMVFYAKMKESLLHKDPASIARAKKELLKMTKDIKNEDLKDVIYYTLGQMEEKDNNTDQALAYYVKSVRNSVANQSQKAKSFLRLADINFERESYTSAAGYYDSTVAIIKEDFPGYADITAKKKSLNALVTQIMIIKGEDSLRKVADMDSSQRNKFIRKIIAKVTEDEKKAAETKQQQAAGGGTPVGPSNVFTPQATTTGSGQWYFYNPLLKAQGINDYLKRWGPNRKNEDNWRRANKAQTFDNNSTDNTSIKKDSTKHTKDSLVMKSNDAHQVEYYLKNLPFTKSDRDTSDKKILEAYYALGSIYREQLNNTRKSAETFETM